jgi:sialate O-acetylesterase
VAQRINSGLKMRILPHLLVTAAVTVAHCSSMSLTPGDSVSAPAGNLTLPKALGSNMVLQRAPKRAALWGWASPGDRLTVTLSGTAPAQAVADGGGAWSVSLPPQCAGGCVDKEITIASADGGSKTLTNVAFGDVLFGATLPVTSSNVTSCKPPAAY